VRRAEVEAVAAAAVESALRLELVAPIAEVVRLRARLDDVLARLERVLGTSPPSVDREEALALVAGALLYERQEPARELGERVRAWRGPSASRPKPNN
jgi:hypothetical protein